MGGLRVLLFGFQYFVELLKTNLRSCKNWVIDILNSTLNIAVIYFLRGLEHTLAFLITRSLAALRFILEIGIHCSIDILSTLSYHVAELIIWTKEIIVRGTVFGLCIDAEYWYDG